MALHHHIKPHHHVAAWAVIALGMILSASVYTNATFAEDQADHQPRYEQQKPSQKTKDFFGGDVKEKKNSRPAACDKEKSTRPEEHFSSDAKTQVDGRPTINKTNYEQLSEEERAKLPADTVIVESHPNVEAPDAPKPELMSEEQKPNEADQTKQKADQEKAFQNFATAECRAAMLAQIQDEMQGFYTKMKSGDFTAKLDNMLAVIEKLQTASLQSFKAAGIDTAELEALFEPIKSDAAELKAFFNEMVAAMEQFFALKASPDEAFTYMRTGFPHGKMTTMAKTADRLVDNIEELQEALAEISLKLELQPSPAASAEVEHE